MNIGIDIRPLMSPVRTGVGEYTYELLNAIFAIDQQNHYWLFYNSSQDIAKNVPKWAQSNVQYVATHWPNKLLNTCLKFSARPRLDKVIKQNLDIFFSPNLNFTALSKKVKHVLTIHDLSFALYPEFFSAKRKLWHWIINPQKQCRQANLILAPSENTKTDIVNYYQINPDKIKIIYPGLSSIFNNQPTVDKEQIRKKYNLPDKFILFLGTIEPRKNIIGIIEALEQAHSRFNQPHSLIIAGSEGWQTKPIKQRIAKSPYKQKIHLIGYIDPQDKPCIYSLATVFVYPSFYEGFGFPILEAMSLGTPVITSNRSSLPEITDNAAYLVNPNKVTEISQAMIKLINEEKLRQHFARAGLEQAQKFNWAEAARQWINLIKV